MICRFTQICDVYCLLESFQQAVHITVLGKSAVQIAQKILIQSVQHNRKTAKFVHLCYLTSPPVHNSTKRKLNSERNTRPADIIGINKLCMRREHINARKYIFRESKPPSSSFYATAGQIFMQVMSVCPSSTSFEFFKKGLVSFIH